MGRLKLQMQVSIDGFVSTQAQTGRGYFNWDQEVRQYSIANAADVNCILIGRKTATGFISHWKSVADNPRDADSAFGKVVTDIPKAVFSKTLRKSEWPNVTVENGDIVDAVNQLKRKAATDLLVYGGSSFAASLIQSNLVDEYHLLVNLLPSEAA